MKQNIEKREHKQTWSAGHQLVNFESGVTFWLSILLNDQMFGKYVNVAVPNLIFKQTWSIIIESIFRHNDQDILTHWYRSMME